MLPALYLEANETSTFSWNIGRLNGREWEGEVYLDRGNWKFLKYDYDGCVTVPPVIRHVGEIF